MIENFKFKKQFGQNFLTDTNLLAAIVKDASIENETVLEIGTGAGALTEEICKKAKKVFSFEIDEELIPYLTEKFKNLKNLSLNFADISKISNEEINNIIKEDFHLVANLPYYITSPLIFKFLDNDKCKSLTVMIQKEVAERIVSPAGSKDYGILSVKLGAMANCKICRQVSRKMFKPEPNVDSAVINIVKKPYNFNKESFSTLVNKAFAMRRKTLQNNLTSGFLTKEQFLKVCESCNISPSIRAENLSIEDFINISKSIEIIRQ